MEVPSPYDLIGGGMFNLSSLTYFYGRHTAQHQLAVKINKFILVRSLGSKDHIKEIKIANLVLKTVLT